MIYFLILFNIFLFKFETNYLIPNVIEAYGPDDSTKKVWFTYRIKDDKFEIEHTDEPENVKPFFFKKGGENDDGETYYFIHLQDEDSKESKYVLDVDTHNSILLGYRYHGGDNQRFQIFSTDINNEEKIVKINSVGRCIVNTPDKIIVGKLHKNLFSKYLTSLCKSSDLEENQINIYKIYPHEKFIADQKNTGNHNTDNMVPDAEPHDEEYSDTEENNYNASNNRNKKSRRRKKRSRKRRKTCSNNSVSSEFNEEDQFDNDSGFSDWSKNYKRMRRESRSRAKKKILSESSSESDFKAERIVKKLLNKKKRLKEIESTDDSDPSNNSYSKDCDNDKLKKIKKIMLDKNDQSKNCIAELKDDNALKIIKTFNNPPNDFSGVNQCMLRPNNSFLNDCAFKLEKDPICDNNGIMKNIKRISNIQPLNFVV